MSSQCKAGPLPLSTPSVLAGEQYSPHMVDHASALAESIGQLFLTHEFADLTIRVDGTDFAVHRVILACRSEYFRALLYGGMRESQESVICLQDINPDSFQILLGYLYTGRANLSEMKEETLLDLFGLAHRFNFQQLEKEISTHLQKSLTLENVCYVCNIGCMYHDAKLQDACHLFMGLQAEAILDSEGFLTLSSMALSNLLRKDNFWASEILILRGVHRWAEAHKLLPSLASSSFSAASSERSVSRCSSSCSNQEATPTLSSASSVVWGLEPELHNVVSAIRLPLMSMDELLGEVRDCRLISPDAILDAIKQKTQCRSSTLSHRGLLVPEENMATQDRGAAVVHGECHGELLGEEVKSYDNDRGFTQHAIDEEKKSDIVVSLPRPTIINCVRFLLWDKDSRCYSYYLEASVADSEWIRVVDHRGYFCRSWQHLYFSPRVVSKLRLVGTYNSANRQLHVVNLQCFYTTKQYQLYRGLLVPLCNVATLAHSAFVREGVSRTRNSLINGDTSNYDWDSGYTCHQLGNGSIIVQLAQPYWINSVRFLLWDLDSRAYSYKVEVSVDLSNWQMVCDRSQEECRSWQVVEFSPRPVCFVRIIGTNNTVNEVFHVVHFECPYSISSLLQECRPTQVDSSTSSSASSSSHALGEGSVSRLASSENLLREEVPVLALGSSTV